MKKLSILFITLKDHCRSARVISRLAGQVAYFQNADEADLTLLEVSV